MRALPTRAASGTAGARSGSTKTGSAVIWGASKKLIRRSTAAWFRQAHESPRSREAQAWNHGRSGRRGEARARRPRIFGNRRSPDRQGDRHRARRGGAWEARTRVGEMCGQLLANPILEDYAVEIVT